MTSPSFTRILALLSLIGVSTALAPSSDAQRHGESPSVILTIGNTEILYALAVASRGVPLTPRSDFSRMRNLTLTGLSLPRGGDKGGNCDWQEPTCNGTITVKDPDAPTQKPATAPTPPTRPPTVGPTKAPTNAAQRTRHRGSGRHQVRRASLPRVPGLPGE